MNPQEYTQPPSQPAPPASDPLPKHHMNNPLSVMQEGEQTICEIKRHPIGLLGVYVMSGALLIVLAVLAFVVVPHGASSDNRGQAIGVAGLLFFLVAAIILAFVYIANKVYWGNSWIVTSDSITQMTQTSLFHKQAAQLSLGNLEDVTSEKNGILANMFNFGLLKAETAGERSKFVFLYCPSPDYYAQKILAAREQFEQVHHGGKQPPAYYAPPPQDQASQAQAIPEQDNRSTGPTQMQPTQQPDWGNQGLQTAPPAPTQPSNQQPQSQASSSSEPLSYYGDVTSADNWPAVDTPTAPPTMPAPPTESQQPAEPQAQPPAYDPGAYRPLYPDTPPSFNHGAPDNER